MSVLKSALDIQKIFLIEEYVKRIVEQNVGHTNRTSKKSRSRMKIWRSRHLMNWLISINLKLTINFFMVFFYCYFALSCQEIKLLMLKSRGLPIISAGCLIFRRLRERSESFVRIRYFCFPNLANLRQVTRPTMNQISILDSCLSLSTPSFNNC